MSVWNGDWIQLQAQRCWENCCMGGMLSEPTQAGTIIVSTHKTYTQAQLTQHTRMHTCTHIYRHNKHTHRHNKQSHKDACPSHMPACTYMHIHRHNKWTHTTQTHTYTGTIKTHTHPAIIKTFTPNFDQHEHITMSPQTCIGLTHFKQSGVVNLYPWRVKCSGGAGKCDGQLWISISVSGSYCGHKITHWFVWGETER